MNKGRIIWKIFSIKKDERGFTLSLFLLYMLLGAFFTFGQIFTETIFLKTYGAGGLSRFFIYNGIALIAAGIFYNYIILRMSLNRGFLLLTIFFPTLIFLSSYISYDEYRWIPFSLYMANYLFTFFLDIHFFNFAFQFLSIRNSKRILPFVMGGGKLGGIFASLLVFSTFSKDIDKFGVYVWTINGVLLILPVLLIGIIFKTGRKKNHPGQEKQIPASGVLQKIIRKIKISYSSPIFIYSILAVFIMSLANQVSEYYFAKIFNSSFATKNQLANFLSIYTLSADFLTLMLQVFAASRIIRILGVKKSNYIYPSSFFSFISLFFLFPGLFMGILLRFFRKNLSLIIRVPVFNVIMAASPKDRMAEVKSFISGIISPLGMIAGGWVILLIYKELLPIGGYIFALGIGLLYLALTLFQNRAYVKSLRNRITYDSIGNEKNGLEYIDYKKLTEPADVEKNLWIIEALFNEHPSIDLLQVIYPFFSVVSESTRLTILNLIDGIGAEHRDEIIQKSLDDTSPWIKMKIYSVLRQYPLDVRKKFLFNYNNRLYSAEEYAAEVLLASENRKTRPPHIENFIIEKKKELYAGILEKNISPVDFLIFCQVFHYSYFLDDLIGLALSTGDELFFKSLIPYSDKISKQKLLEILLKFRNSDIDLLVNFCMLSDNLSEFDKSILMDYRVNMSQSDIERLYKYDDRTLKEVTGRLFSRYSFMQKSNYLKYIMCINAKPEKELSEFISFELLRIIEVMEIINSLALLAPMQERIRHDIVKFIEAALNSEIEFHKHLIMKAIAILTGMHLDEMYESVIFLKDRELNSLIFEYIETSSTLSRDLMFIFDRDISMNDHVKLDRFEFENSLRDRLELSSVFIPELAENIAFIMSQINNENNKIADPAEDTEEGMLFENYTREELEMLSFIEKISFLKENALFNELMIDELIHISRITAEFELPQNKILIKEGETGDELYIIVNGEVRVFTDERDFGLLAEGSCIGELAIIDKEPRSATVKTTKKTRFLSINRKDFLLTLKENPAISINIMKVVTGRLRKFIK